MRIMAWSTVLMLGLFVFANTSSAESIVEYGPGEKAGNVWGNVKIQEYLDTLPNTSTKAIEDRNIVTMPGGGARVFRLYKPSSPHYHAKSDAILYVLSGKGEYEVADGSTFVAEAGTMMYWRAGTAHRLKKLIEGPLDVLIFDVGVREPSDTIFLDPKDEGSFKLQ